MKVADYLEACERSVLTVKASETIGYLARQLQRHRIGVMVVSDTGAALNGAASYTCCLSPR